METLKSFLVMIIAGGYIASIFILSKWIVKGRGK